VSEEGGSNGLEGDENTEEIEGGTMRIMEVPMVLKHRKWMFLTMIAVCGVMVSGIWITAYLVDKARQQMIRDHEAAALTISTFLSAEFTKIEGAVRALAVSPWIAPALVTESKRDLERADSALTGYQRSLGAAVCYVINAQGMTIASSNRKQPDSFVGKSYQFRPYFQEAIRGIAFSQMAMGITSQQRGFYTSAPVSDETGRIVGVVVIKKDLGSIEEFMDQSPLCFLIDKHGVIFLAGRRELIFHSLWPLNQATKNTLIATHQYGSGAGLSSPLLPEPLSDRGEVSFKGGRYLASRRPVSLTGWSLVHLTKVGILKTYWILGSIMTFIICALILVPVGYLFQVLKSEAAIRRSEERFRLLIENAPDAIYVHAGARFIYLNRAAVNLFGAETAEQLIGSPIMDRFHPDYHGMIAKRLHDVYEERKELPIVEQPYLRLDGSLVPVEVHAVPINYYDKSAALTFVRDITDRKQAEKALRASEKRYRELSIVDHLTQLYNSRHFYDQLKMEIDRVDRYGQPLTLLLLDLDDFKRFNDTYGHIEGDHVLSRLGYVIKRCLRQTDSAYRYGGEEFVILLPMTTEKDGAVTAERIRAEFKGERFLPAPGQEVCVTVSIGLAQYEPQEEMKAFVHRVDQLMYQGKKNGKDRVCCDGMALS
jgi:diguanylate cyclase (GGDEF)-like protein/PAS domain S-box-containing protein